MTAAPAKLARLGWDLDEKRASLRGIGGAIADDREHLADIKQVVFMRTNRFNLAEVWDGKNLDDLDALGDDELEAQRIDRATLRNAITVRDRMAELTRRKAVLEAEVAPLARLVERLQAFVAGRT